MDNIITGIDIGGTHITVCKVDLNTMEVIEASRVRSDIDTKETTEHIIDAWAKAIRSCSHLDNGTIGRIGIALPGPFDYANGISLIKGLDKYESLYQLNVKELLAKELNITATDIRMMNDATAFLLGEWKGGSGQGYKNIVGLTLGTGLGSANCFNDTMEDGDLWSMPFGNSRAEDLLCARWFIKEYETRTKHKATNVKELSERAVDNDAVAVELFQEFGRTLGEVLIMRYAANFPEHLVIGGNVAKSWDLFYPFCKKTLNQFGYNPTVLPAMLGEDAALIGAACLWGK